ncbi:hypothetical protein GALMADRAFT_442853 [Galerina marginata CBS 339.88]|uniref:Uncharacterized protein n=1 Tax=Galerina marginata (strain CBS 339.88) TaxID=685588 RepID=A0A067TEC2_GALM3|nr:hypothetical protein GALMADRAFT_442853 [Galerina marginata CBS 339.88]
MANTSCSFPSINDVLAQAGMGELNITTTVNSCPGICTLAWGTGNPDLSGIGANVSYILQAVLTCIFGPLFCLVYGFRKRWNFSEKTNEILEMLQDAFLDVSAQFSIPVAVAAVIRFRQHAPFYEIAFLRSLTTMQFLSLLSTTVTSGIFNERKDALRITVLVFYGLLEFGFYMGLIGGLRTSKQSWETLTELSEACKAYNHILPWFAYIPPPSLHLPHITAKQYFNPFSKQGAGFAAIIFGFIVAGVIALLIAIAILGGLAAILISQEVKILGPISLAFTIGMLVEVVQMEHTRDVMRAVTGPEFQDNQWGFGQVIALFLWAPLGIQIIYHAAHNFPDR